MLRHLRHRLHVRALDLAGRAVREAVAPMLAEQEARRAAEVAALHAELASLRDDMHAREVRERRDILAAGERDAVASSAVFVREAMPGARTLPTPAATLQHALALAPTGGMALEFGVFSGTTLRTIAEARAGTPVFGFDAFEGLPENWRAGFSRGAFAVEAPPQVVGAELVVGWFADTLPGFLAEHPDPVDLLHLDADLYSSTATVLEHVGPRLRPGSVVVFDEYLNHPGWENGEHRAWTEHVARCGVEFAYDAFTHDHEQVVVVITGDSTGTEPVAGVNLGSAPATSTSTGGRPA